LLNAIGLELARGKRAVVACLSTQAFVDELIAAIDGDRVDWWRARYRRATALLLDDIHLIAGKERTQEELFNLFNLLQDKERQRVVGAAAAQDGPLTAGLAREVLEGQAPRDSRRSAGFRTSGIVVSSLGGIKSREKMVWDWSDVADRVIEEFR